jgi:hypothetical protein
MDSKVRRINTGFGSDSKGRRINTRLQEGS